MSRVSSKGHDRPCLVVHRDVTLRFDEARACKKYSRAEHVDAQEGGEQTGAGEKLSLRGRPD